MPPSNHANRMVGCGQSGMVYHLTPSTVLKTPWVRSKDDIEVERQVYERLGPHPRILKYLGLGPKPIDPKYASQPRGLRLEFQARGSLRLLLPSDEEAFPIKWAEQIAEGIELLHRHGIVHCDVSTSNVLITQSLDAVLCEFAAASIDGFKASNVYYERRCLRRYDYLKDFGTQDDLFAFGTLLYELFTRTRPYADKTDEEIRQLYKKGEFPDVSHLEMGDIIYKCWRDGYEDISDVLVDIRRDISV